MNISHVIPRTLRRILLLLALFAPVIGHEASASLLDDVWKTGVSSAPACELITTAPGAGAVPPGGSIPILHARREDIFTRGASALYVLVAVLPLAVWLPPLPAIPCPAAPDIPTQRDADLPVTPPRAPPSFGTYR